MKIPIKYLLSAQLIMSIYLTILSTEKYHNILGFEIPDPLPVAVLIGIN
jgi:hypothetical protein